MPMNSLKTTNRGLIGWREWVCLEDFGPSWVKAKIDTGAKTSAIHAENIRIFEQDGRKMVQFDLFPEQKSRAFHRKLILPLIDRRRIRSSNGHQMMRPIVLSHLRIGQHRFQIELSLVGRDMMGFRMLLGRDALAGKFDIRPDGSFLHLSEKKGKLKNQQIHSRD